MIWDEAPPSFGAQEIEMALGIATDAEAGSGSLTSLADVLKQRGEAVRDEQPGVGLLLIADGLACDLWLTRGASTVRWGPLGPMMELQGGVYPPPLTTFADSPRPYFEQRATTTGRADLRARYHDLIWLRWRQFANARGAYAAYVEASAGADLSEASSAMTACDHLIRATELSMTLDIDQAMTIELLRREILRGLPREVAGYACRLADDGASLLARRTCRGHGARCGP